VDITVIDHFSAQQIQQVHRLYQQVWWAKSRSLEETQLCIAGSQVCIGILDNNQQLIAFVRVVSDFIYKAIIFDVIVSPESRATGLGKTLMTLVKTHHALNKVKHFELYCLPEMATFYEQLGFSSDVGGIALMRHVK